MPDATARLRNAAKLWLPPALFAVGTIWAAVIGLWPVVFLGAGVGLAIANLHDGLAKVWYELAHLARRFGW